MPTLSRAPPRLSGLCWRMKVRVKSVPSQGRSLVVAPTMVRLRKLVNAWEHRNVSVPLPGHITLCVMRQQSLSG